MLEVRDDRFMKACSRALKALCILLLALPPAARAGDAGPDSLSIKIGQMLMVGFRGMSLEEAKGIEDDITSTRIGGVVLFDYDVPSKSPQRNISSPEQLQRLTGELQAIAKIPLFIAIDQEGGRIARLKTSRGFPPSVSARHLGSLDAADSTRTAGRSMAETLHALGITMDFAPVVDLDRNPECPVIGKLDRSFSADPDIVARNASIMAEELEREQVIPVLKHFPGHGSATADSHLGFTDVTATWSPVELEPYRIMFRDGYNGAVMTAHVFNAKIDPNYPATLSASAIDGILRAELGFRGVVVSDDLQMKAIAGHYGLRDAIRLAIEAGVDILLFANNGDFDPEIARKASAIIRSLVEEESIPEERIEQSWRRIMALKQQRLK